MNRRSFLSALALLPGVGCLKTPTSIAPPVMDLCRLYEEASLQHQVNVLENAWVAPTGTPFPLLGEEPPAPWTRIDADDPRNPPPSHSG